jgi:hypothetical protein
MVSVILQVLTIIRPETLVRWHRAGFRCYWRWKSRSLGGRPQIETDLRVLIRRMSIENPLWGAPRIHGELLKLGFEVAQSSVAKHMVKRRGALIIEQHDLRGVEKGEQIAVQLRLRPIRVTEADAMGSPSLGDPVAGEAVTVNPANAIKVSSVMEKDLEVARQVAFRFLVRHH